MNVPEPIKAKVIVSGLLLNIMPGPDSLLIMTRSATQGWRAGVAATMGICTGTMVHVLAAAVGLSMAATPLLLFAAGARRISLTTMGILQYISPSLQLLLALQQQPEGQRRQQAGHRHCCHTPQHLGR